MASPRTSRRGGLLLTALVALLPPASSQAAPTRRPGRAARPAPAPAPTREAPSSTGAENPAGTSTASNASPGGPTSGGPTSSGPTSSGVPASTRLELPAVPAPRREREPVRARVEAKGGFRPDRLGVALDVYFEGSRMEGERSIASQAPVRQSFDYGAGHFSGTAYLLTRPAERLRVGPGVRVLGVYGGRGERPYRFGILNEAFAMGEYAHPAIERFELVLGLRAGLSLLVPTDEFAQDIRTEQAAGAGVWSVPRVGWLAGASVGARRRMAENLYLRADVLGQLGSVFLYATDQQVRVGEGTDEQRLRFRKVWRADQRRLGMTLGVELGF